MMGTFVYANLANYILSGKFIWQNEPGKDRFHVDSGMRDENGKKVYWRYGKQYQELLDFALGPPGYAQMNFLRRKTMPYLQKVTPSFASAEGFPTELGKAIEQAAREGKELDGKDYSLLWAADLLEGFGPFGAEQVKGLTIGNDRPRAISIVPLPASKGMSMWRARSLMAAAYRDGDDDMVKRVVSALEENGYSNKDIQAARRQAKKLARKHP